MPLLANTVTVANQRVMRALHNVARLYKLRKSSTLVSNATYPSSSRPRSLGLKTVSSRLQFKRLTIATAAIPRDLGQRLACTHVRIVIRLRHDSAVNTRTDSRHARGAPNNAFVTRRTRLQQLLRQRLTLSGPAVRLPRTS